MRIPRRKPREACGEARIPAGGSRQGPLGMEILRQKPHEACDLTRAMRDGEATESGRRHGAGSRAWCATMGAAANGSEQRKG
nr:unnamed protein product [Digitaria exilis]